MQTLVHEMRGIPYYLLKEYLQEMGGTLVEENLIRGGWLECEDREDGTVSPRFAFGGADAFDDGDWKNALRMISGTVYEENTSGRGVSAKVKVKSD